MFVAFIKSRDFWTWYQVKVKESESEVAQSCLTLCTPWTVAHQAPPSMGFSRQEYWSGLPFPSPGDLPNPGIKPRSPALQADILTSEPPGKPKYAILICEGCHDKVPQVGDLSKRNFSQFWSWKSQIKVWGQLGWFLLRLWGKNLFQASLLGFFFFFFKFIYLVAARGI